MLNLNSLNNIDGLGIGSQLPWYKQGSLRLNGVLPTLAYEFTKNRYAVNRVGAAFPFSSVRTTNAMRHDSLGRLVFAPANMIAQSSMAGAVLGIVGSGGAVPTGWQVSAATGLTHDVVEIGSDYIDIRISGTNPTGGIVYPHIYFMTLTTAVVGQSYTLSASVQIVGGSFTNFTTAGRLTTQFFNGAVYLNEAVNGGIPTTSMARYFSTGAPTNLTTTNYRPNMSFSVPSLATVDVTVRISQVQEEYTDINSPNPYNLTTGTAYYGPRFDYNPTTLLPIGLLSELNATNLVPASQNLTNALVAKTAVTISGSTTSPSGFTANRVQEDATLAEHYVSREGMTTVASTRHFASVYAKADQRSSIDLAYRCTTSGDVATATFNLTTGVISAVSVSGGVTSPLTAIQDVGNGWWRCTLSAITDAGVITSFRVKLNTGATAFYTGDGTSGLYIWGMQFEQGLCLTSYIPTFEAAATRAIDATSTALGSWFDATKGTIVAVYHRPFDSALFTTTPFTVSDGGLNNRIQIQSSTSIGIVHRSAAVNFDYSGATTVAAVGATQKLAYRYDPVGARYVGNGGAVVSSGTAAAPVTPNNLRIGGNFGAVNQKSFMIALYYYPDNTASDAQLQAITT